MRRGQSVQIRLEVIKKQGTKLADSELNQPLFVRVLRPILDNISKTVLKITPREIVSSLEKKVLMAGKSNKLSVKDLINIQVAIVLGLPLLTIFLSYRLGAELKQIIYFVFIEMALGLILPNFFLSKKITARQKKIQNTLPDIIDLLTVSVEAGLGFDGALAKVIDKMPGPLADEFEDVLQEIKVGKQKRDALRDMADRINVQDLSTFVSSIIQADQFGVGIGNVLRLQSEQMRQKRRQRAQEKAMKAPVKMVIPMVLFIFPTLFSVLLGPVVIQIIDTLGK
jgi:Flp pilus assembly protein TadC